MTQPSDPPIPDPEPMHACTSARCGECRPAGGEPGLELIVPPNMKTHQNLRRTDRRIE